ATPGYAVPARVRGPRGRRRGCPAAPRPAHPWTAPAPSGGSPRYCRHPRDEGRRSGARPIEVVGTTTTRHPDRAREHHRPPTGETAPMAEHPKTSTRIVLASRPDGAPTPENFRTEVDDLPEVADGQVLL